MTFRQHWTSFTSGELGEILEYRSDTTLYQTGLRRCRNAIVLPQGPVTSRLGFRRFEQFDAGVRFIDYVFDEIGQAYLFCLGGGSLRVYLDGVLQAIVAIPYSDADLRFIRWVSKGDSTLIFHSDYQPREVRRLGSHTSWSVSPISFDQWPTFKFADHGHVTLTPSGTTGTVTLTASSNLFDASWNGIVVRFINDAGVDGVTVISAVTDATHATATVFVPLPATTATENWQEMAWSPRRGWPRCGNFHQSRLVIGGSRSLPQTVFASVVGFPFNFDPKRGTILTDDDAITHTLSSDSINTILEVFSIRNSLQIFTTSAEWTERSVPFSPKTPGFQRATTHGMYVNGIRITSIDSDSVFIDRTGKQARALSFDFTTDAFTAKNLTVASPSMLNGPIEMAYIKGLGGSQGNHVLVLNSDGSIATLAFDADQKVLGWSKQEFPSCTVRSMVRLVDDVWALIEYQGHRYICRLRSTDDTYLDLWQSATSGPPTTVWSGFTTFANQTVAVEGDGYSFPSVEVDAFGSFTLPNAVSSIKAGLPYWTTIECLPLAPIINGQLMRGERIALKKAIATVRNTKDLWIQGKFVPLRTLGDDLLDEPIAEKDETYRVFLSGIGPEPTVVIESRLSKPLTLIGLVVEYNAPTP